MRYLVLTLALVFSLWAPPSLADRGDVQLFQQIAQTCGTGEGQQTYSEAEYAMALAEAARAAKAAKGNKTQVAGIAASIKTIEFCKKEKAFTLERPKVTTCKDLHSEYYRLAVAAVQRSGGTNLSASDARKLAEQFKKQADYCMRLIVSSCIDPLNTEAVLQHMNIIEIAELTGIAKSYASAGSLEAKLIELDPRNLRPKFCTDTDFACTKLDPAHCRARVKRIKDLMRTYIEK